MPKPIRTTANPDLPAWVDCTAQECARDNLLLDRISCAIALGGLLCVAVAIAKAAV